MVSAIGKIPYQSLLGDASLSEEQNSLVEKIKHDVTQAPIYMCHEELDSDALCTLAEKYVRLEKSEYAVTSLKLNEMPKTN